MKSMSTYQLDILKRLESGETIHLTKEMDDETWQKRLKKFIDSVDEQDELKQFLKNEYAKKIDRMA